MRKTPEKMNNNKALVCLVDPSENGTSDRAKIKRFCKLKMLRFTGFLEWEIFRELLKN